MILTDDNFATIVKAVEYGRALYDNLAKYIRFQMTSLVAFITAFLGAALFGIAGGIPFSPLQVLWINFAITVPIAIALGFDKPSPGLMERKPRPLLQPVLSRVQWLRIVFLALFMAAGTLLVEQYFGLPLRRPCWRRRWGRRPSPCSTSSPASAAGVRPRPRSAATSWPTGARWASTDCPLLLTILATELGFLQRVLGTTVPGWAAVAPLRGRRGVRAGGGRGDQAGPAPAPGPCPGPGPGPRPGPGAGVRRERLHFAEIAPAPEVEETRADDEPGCGGRRHHSPGRAHRPPPAAQTQSSARDPAVDGDVRARRRHVADERLDLGGRARSRHDRQRGPVGHRARSAGVRRLHPDRQQDRRPLRAQTGVCAGVAGLCRRRRWR